MTNLYGSENAEGERDGWKAVKRGLARRCPCCGEKTLFAGWLKPNTTCSACGLEIDAYRADDGPAYLSILVIGHVIVPLMMMVDPRMELSPFIHMALWGPLSIALCLLSLPLFKGMLIGWQWARDMKADERF